MNKLEVNSTEEWCQWLKLNHAIEDEIWLVYYKKHTGKFILDYDESVKEAICFGWIDGLMKRIDYQKYARKFTPRRKNSIWSALNVQRAEEMMAKGKMTEAGIREIEKAKKNGNWQKAKEPPKQVILSPELEEMLKNDLIAWDNFKSLSPSHKKRYVGWIMSAKREDTRIKRTREAIISLRQNQLLEGK